MTHAIEMGGVGKTYAPFNLDLDLVVPEGSVMGLVGPNGAGKSTTLHIAMGLVQADRGGRGPRPRKQIAAK